MRKTGGVNVENQEVLMLDIKEMTKTVRPVDIKQP